MAGFGKRAKAQQAAQEAADEIALESRLEKDDPDFACYVLCDYALPVDLHERTMTTLARTVDGRYDGRRLDLYMAEYRLSSEATCRKRGREVLAPPAFDISDASIITVGEEEFRVAQVHSPFPYDLENEGLKPVRTFDPTDALAEHHVHFVVAATEGHDDPEARKRQARIVMHLAATLSVLLDTRALYWAPSQCFMDLDTATRAVESGKSGETPIACWVQVYPTVAVEAGGGGEGHWGAVTLGLEPLIGREIEIAAAPRSSRDAVEDALRIALALLDDGARFEDGESVARPDGTGVFTVRDVPQWLRHGIPALVFVSGDSVIDPRTLAPMPSACAS